jgi:glyoxylase-like metal-dependent hydrolase (beta-lactamase superfamily II)
MATARAALLDGAHTLAEVAERLDLQLRADLLVPLSRWVTPPFVERRFDVRFFASELPAGIEPSFVGGEVIAHRWLTPTAALAAMGSGEISMWVPTAVTLQQLEHVERFAQIRERLAPREPGTITSAEVTPAILRVVLPEAGGVAGQDVNAYLVGRREMVVVDPGDPSDAAAEALLGAAQIRGGGVVGIALTSTDPAHAAGAEALAGRIEVPVYAGPGAGQSLAFTVEQLQRGAPLPVGDLVLTVLAAPGPRPDHVALVAAEEAAVFVGDLVGPGASRSISGPPGVPAWLDSLDRLANLAPRRVLPGHDEPPADVVAAIDARRSELLEHGGPS